MKIEWVIICKALKTVTSPIWALSTRRLWGLLYLLKKVHHRSVWLRSGGRCGKEGWSQTWVSHQRGPCHTRAFHTQGPTHLPHLPPTESLSRLPCPGSLGHPGFLCRIYHLVLSFVFLYSACCPCPLPNSIVSSSRKEGKYLWIQSLSSVLCYESEVGVSRGIRAVLESHGSCFNSSFPTF